MMRRAKARTSRSPVSSSRLEPQSRRLSLPPVARGIFTDHCTLITDLAILLTADALLHLGRGSGGRGRCGTTPGRPGSVPWCQRSPSATSTIYNNTTADHSRPCATPHSPRRGSRRRGSRRRGSRGGHGSRGSCRRGSRSGPGSRRRGAVGAVYAVGAVVRSVRSVRSVGAEASAGAEAARRAGAEAASRAGAEASAGAEATRRAGAEAARSSCLG